MKRSELFFTLILIPVDIIMIAAGFLIAYFIREHFQIIPVTNQISLGQYLLLLVYVIPIWLVVFALSGLYSLQVTRRGIGEIKGIIVSVTAGMAVLIGVIFLTRHYELFFSRLVLIYAWIFAVMTVIFGRYIIHFIQRFLYKYGIGVYNTVVIGTSNEMNRIINALNNSTIGYRLVAQIQKTEDLETVLAEQSINTVICAQPDLPTNLVLNLIEVCEKNHLEFKFVPPLYQLLSSHIRIGTLDSLPILELQRTPLDGWGRILKRFIDITASLGGLLIVSPLLVFVSLLTKVTSRGPIIYSHNRIGRDGKKFKVYKFRSMYINAEHSVGHTWSVKDESKDPRITPLGRILRRTAIDELPQLFNVFIGDMSLVGPRPEQPTYVEKFEQEIPDYFRRHQVKSGITGWAQINGLRGDTSIPERVKYDIFYIENWSIWFDVKIIFKTLLMILRTGQGNEN